MVERLIGPLRVRRHGAAELAALAVFIAHASEIVLAQHVIVRDRLRIPDGLRVRLLSHIVVPLTGLIHRRRTMPATAAPATGYHQLCRIGPVFRAKSNLCGRRLVRLANPQFLYS